MNAAQNVAADRTAAGAGDGNVVPNEQNRAVRAASLLKTAAGASSGRGGPDRAADGNAGSARAQGPEERSTAWLHDRQLLGRRRHYTARMRMHENSTAADTGTVSGFIQGDVHAVAV